MLMEFATGTALEIYLMSYHVNPKSGNVGLCKATKGGCPFGGADEHFESKREAQVHYEAQQQGSFSPKVTIDADGFLSEESEKLVNVRGISCHRCGRGITGKEMRLMTDEFVEIDCDCGAILSIYEVELTIDPSHPSYRFVQDKEAVKDAVWYHATMNDDWLSPQDPSFNNWRARPQYKDGSFKAHVGSHQAAMDRALSQLVTHEDSRMSNDDGFWLYEVKIAQDADVIEGIASDDNSDDYDEFDPDVERYENRFEDPASISLTVRSSKLEIVGRKRIKRQEAYYSPSIYNIRTDS